MEENENGFESGEYLCLVPNPKSVTVLDKHTQDLPPSNSEFIDFDDLDCIPVEAVENDPLQELCKEAYEKFKLPTSNSVESVEDEYPVNSAGVKVCYEASMTFSFSADISTGVQTAKYSVNSVGQGFQFEASAKFSVSADTFAALQAGSFLKSELRTLWDNNCKELQKILTPQSSDAACGKSSQWQFSRSLGFHQDKIPHEETTSNFAPSINEPDNTQDTSHHLDKSDNIYEEFAPPRRSAEGDSF